MSRDGGRFALAALPRLRGARVDLREPSSGDAGDLYRVFSDPAVMRYWSSAPMQSPREALELIDDIVTGRSDGSFFQWGIELRDALRLVGTVTLFRLDAMHRRAELGFALASDCWGQGFAGEAVSLAIEHAFGALDLHRLEADVDPRNTASLSLLARLGFVKEGLMRERYHVSGEVQDSVMLGLLRGEWRARP